MNSRGDRHQSLFVEKLYPAYSRKAAQVCILMEALEDIEQGAADPVSIAREALKLADPFGWAQRRERKKA